MQIPKSKTIGITGAGGSLGKALTKEFRSHGYKIIGFTHNRNPQELPEGGPNEWVYWECGKEFLLENSLSKIDILILNHGIYDSKEDLEQSIEINAISTIKILRLFEKISLSQSIESSSKEIWINTSEAEILPALNPCYEISKSLIGQVVTFKKNFNNQNESTNLIIRKIILGPFKSNLNPIGIMSPELVASLIFYIAKFSNYLIIVSPNPLTYILFPLRELYFFGYYQFLKFFKKRFSN
tara:strand:- start:189 stop:908 length:720 start_codon:yes stop_codon:yes gene_type:complete